MIGWAQYMHLSGSASERATCYPIEWSRAKMKCTKMLREPLPIAKNYAQKCTVEAVSN